MSSTYLVLCMSHDPALIVSEHSSSERAEQLIKDGFEPHADCDLLISRMSGAIVEVGCLGRNSPGRDTWACGGHSDVQWMRADWLRLLHLFRTTEFKENLELVHRLAKSNDFRCWSPERLRRLRHELYLVE